jgi:hypothetical protein
VPGDLLQLPAAAGGRPAGEARLLVPQPMSIREEERLPHDGLFSNEHHDDNPLR